MTGLSDAPGGEDRSLMDRWVNDAIRRLLERTQVIVQKFTITLTAGTDEYVMPTSVLTAYNYGQPSTAPSAKFTVMNAADLLERKFLSAPGTVRFFAVLGNRFFVSPVPTTADTFNFWGVPMPTDIATTQDLGADAGLPAYAFRAVEAYVFARCFEQARDFKNSMYWDNDDIRAPGIFQKECSAIRITNRRQAGRTLPRSRIGYPDQVNVSARNDVYP